jgi:membrane-associated protease RseP (regulator of RpoE activity)
VDAVVELLQTFQNEMDSVTTGNILVQLVVAVMMIPVLVLVHELGHALAAWMLGHEVRELRVGNDSTGLAVRRRSFTLRLGPITGERGYAGYVLFDGSRAGAWHALLISLAGPVASLAAAAAAAVAMIALQSHTLALMLPFLAGLEMGLVNLSARASDGQQVRTAWRALRSPASLEPNEATSVPPPGY